MKQSDIADPVERFYTMFLAKGFGNKSSELQYCLMLISVVKSGTNAVKFWLYVGNFFDWYFPGAGSDTLIN